METQMEPDTAAAMAIQAWWRGQLVRRALLVAASSAQRIQGWWRRVGSQRREQQRLWVLAEYIKLERAIVLLQAQVRAWVMRTEYKRCQEAARTIQTCWREYVQRRAGNCTKDVDLHIDIVLGIPGDCGTQSE
ncbi:IQ domain-containing protein F6 isoform X1 [Tympanuchus pallidicinctus]|uniref:IQ domain-containing protein F6 isoform X1 n=2 Tax=Tympanuchus pallidicinctus TaxID=109042 RepID=UPI002286D1F6|nr:IQ domain-containing protein F6 isoform X1 [Tympanuchus pallidicinctus]